MGDIEVLRPFGPYLALVEADEAIYHHDLMQSSEDGGSCTENALR